jgi:glutamate--cysteine ligase
MSASGVDRVFERRLAAISNSREQQLLARGSRGLERESLRVTPEGRIAQTPHPPSLGSALTNPHITTDYSEALTELVTPTFPDNDSLVAYLCDLHQFVYRHLGEELLWATSMPCDIRNDDEIPIARYGSSHQGRLKSIYRHGLKVRYGGMMQAISGVHFNYSLPVAFWPLYADLCQNHDSGQVFRSASYFELLRNYRRHGWIVSYLFGASPALCRSFLQGRSDPALTAFGSETLIGPYATSLRMSDIGYRNRNQAEVAVSVNSLEEYLRDLRHAIHAPHAPFAALGVLRDHEYQQLCAADRKRVLQLHPAQAGAARGRAHHPGAGTGRCRVRGGARPGQQRLRLRGGKPTQAVLSRGPADRAAAEGKSADRCQ